MTPPTPAVIAMIAALDRRHAIGRDNALPWRLPDDLKRFKALTLGKPVLMGRRTAESLGRALPGRRNIVLTRRGKTPFDGMQASDSIEAALASTAADGTLMVIGGGEVYAALLPRATHLYLTHVDTVVDGADAFFPEVHATDWTITRRSHHPADDRHAFAFDFVDYLRAGGGQVRAE